MAEPAHEGQTDFLETLVSLARRDTHTQRAGDGYKRITGAISRQQIRLHLRSAIPLSVYPQVGAETQIGVIDLDDHDHTSSPEVVAGMVVDIMSWIAEHGFKAMAFRSGGGRGAHIWVLFKRKQSCARVREFLRQAIAKAGLTVGTEGVSAMQGEIFPKSDDTYGGFGSAISLPLSRASTPLDGQGHPLPEGEGWEPPNIDAVLNSDLTGFDAPRRKSVPRQRYVTSPSLIEAALGHVDSDDRDDWIRAGLALKHELGDGGYDLWLDWSAKSEKFAGERQTQKTWDGLRPDGRVSAASIFRMAKAGGWKPEDEENNDAIIAELNSLYGIVARGNRPLVFEKYPSDPLALYETMSLQTFKVRMNAEPPAMVPPKRKGGNELEPVNRGTFWLNHQRAAHYQRAVFNPALPPGDNDGTWNLWRGFSVRPVEGDWSLFETFIRDVIAGGEQAIAEWVFNWMAYAIQHPAKPIGTALVLKGEPGTGKTFFAETFGALFGIHYVSITAHAHVSGNFNAHFIGKRFVFIDEGYYSGDRKNLGALKVMLTNATIMMEKKGFDAEKMENHMFFAMASNERAAAPADTADRRWMTVRVSSKHKEDHEYFGAIDALMQQGGLSAMLFDLQRRDLSKGPNPRKIIRTTELASDWLAHAPPEAKYLYQLFDSGVLPEADPGFPNITTIDAMWRGMKDTTGSVTFSSQNSLAKFIKDVLPRIETDQRRHGRMPSLMGPDRSKRYIFPPLAACRQAFGVYCGLPLSWSDSVASWINPEDNSPI